MKFTTEKNQELPPPFKPKMPKKKPLPKTTTYALSNGQFLTLKNENFNDLNKQLTFF